MQYYAFFVNNPNRYSFTQRTEAANDLCQAALRSKEEPVPSPEP